MITARIIKDSINAATDDRLTTFVLEYPRFVHAEFMTHRQFSRNAASTRAIPTKKMIEKLLNNPAMPVFWGKNKPGMQAAEEVENTEAFYALWSELTNDPDYNRCAVISNHVQGNKDLCKKLWISARNSMISVAERLERCGLHKQIAGRILEPWFLMTTLVSATEWDNFFALRAHPDAQPEIRVLAEKMLLAYNTSIPKVKDPYAVQQNNWHIPFEENMPDHLDLEGRIKVAVARCARVSYTTFEGTFDVKKDFDLYQKLVGSDPIHASPLEHIAMPAPESVMCGNFKGWTQYRKMFKQENTEDSRVVKRKVINGKVV
jgi:thymidylate synthase ThyX